MKLRENTFLSVNRMANSNNAISTASLKKGDNMHPLKLTEGCLGLDTPSQSQGARGKTGRKS